MNAEAKAIVMVLLNTGCRLSEMVGLTQNTIHLDAKTPYISIELENRQLKTANARRTIPLVGRALEAIREFPNGFARYADKCGSLSAVIGKFLRQHNLFETKDHTLCSLRHSFEDRMLAAKVDKRIRRDFMGHALYRERYGNGASMEMKHELLSAIAY